MTKYQYLLSKKESGELSILFHDFELPLKYAQWMDIYAYRFMAEGIAHDFVVAHSE